MTSRTSPEWRTAAVVCAVAFLGLTLWVRFEGPIPFDGRLLRAGLQGTFDPDASVTGLYAFFAGLGSPLVAALTVATAFAIVLRNVGLAAALLVPAAGAISLTEPLLSHWLGYTQAARELGFPSGGYPSGHAAFTLPTFGILAWLGARHGRPEVVAIALAVIVLMALSRVASRAHLLDEVLGGYLLGGAWLCLVIAVAGHMASGNGQARRSSAR